MALTPDSLSDEIIDEMEEIEEELDDPSLTWRLDLEKGRIHGMLNEEDAVIQFAQKALSTARNRYLIYTDDYGSELDELIGEDVTDAYLDAEIPRMIRDALIYDDRVDEVSEIRYERKDSDLYITMVLETIYGDIETEVIV